MPSSARRTTGGAPPSVSHSAGLGCRRKTCTSRPAASARSTSRWPVGSRVRPKSEMRSGRSSSDGVLAQARARGFEPLGGARLGQPLAQPPPQLRLPRGLRREVDLAARPAAHHRRPVQRVAVEQLGEVADGREAARAPVRVVLVAQMDGEAAQPRLRPGTRRRPRAAATRPAPAATGPARGRSRTRPRRRRRRAGEGTGTRRSRRCRRSGRASRRGSPTSAASASAPSRGSGRR